jgi:hypothetical protein
MLESVALLLPKAILRTGHCVTSTSYLLRWSVLISSESYDRAHSLRCEVMQGCFGSDALADLNWAGGVNHAG